MGVMIPTRNMGATNEMPSANSSETQETLYSVTRLQLIWPRICFLLQCHNKTLPAGITAASLNILTVNTKI